MSRVKPTGTLYALPPQGGAIAPAVVSSSPGRCGPLLLFLAGPAQHASSCFPPSRAPLLHTELRAAPPELRDYWPGAGRPVLRWQINTAVDTDAASVHVIPAFCACGQMETTSAHTFTATVVSRIPSYFCSL